MNVAEQLVAQLIDAGVHRVYGIVGDSLNPIVDAIRKSGGSKKGGIDWVHVRHEEAAAFAAAAEAQPPASSLSAQVHAARETSTSSMASMTPNARAHPSWLSPRTFPASRSARCTSKKHIPIACLMNARFTTR